jgi:selenide,water dikinase
LLGHLHHVALASGCATVLVAAAVPTFPAVRAHAEAGRVPGGSRRNLQYVTPVTRFDPGLGETDRLILADAQTSGGLLLAVPPENEAALLAGLREAGTPACAVIGEFTAGEAGHIEVRASVSSG